MDIQNIFYGVGIFFLFMTIGYFINTYLDYISSGVKVILSFSIAVLLFIVADYLRRLDK